MTERTMAGQGVVGSAMGLLLAPAGRWRVVCPHALGSGYPCPAPGYTPPV